jgi:hypothetical protein
MLKRVQHDTLKIPRQSLRSMAGHESPARRLACLPAGRLGGVTALHTGGYLQVKKWFFGIHLLEAPEGALFARGHVYPGLKPWATGLPLQ